MPAKKRVKNSGEHHSSVIASGAKQSSLLRSALDCRAFGSQ
jgi:hypothetical protein